MSFHDDQRAEILSVTEQTSSESFRDLDTGPGAVGPVGTGELWACPPSQSGRRVGGGGTFTLPARGSRPSPRRLQLGSGEAAFMSLSFFFFFIEVTRVPNSI